MNVYLDCRCGVSGRAVLAALCHAGAGQGPDAAADKGLNVAVLQEMLREAGVVCRLALREVSATDGRSAGTNSGFAGPGCTVEVHGADGEVREKLAHATALRDVLRKAPGSEAVRCKAVAVLDALVEAEAHAASCPPEEICFEESQAVHTLVAILGVCWGLETLGVQCVLASPLPWVSGKVARLQGSEQVGDAVGTTMQPLPRAATARLLHGKPVFVSDHAGETSGTGEVVTALGAALVHVLAEDFFSTMQGRLHNVGVGYDGDGTSVRVLLLEEDAFASVPCATAPHASRATGEDAVRRETITLLESHIDHLSGEELGVAIQELAALPEVLDVLWLPGIGKKNRPAGSLRVLCLPRHVAAVERAFFAHTHSLGVRCQHMERAILPRGACTVDTASGPLRAKRYSVDGAEYVRVECDALRAAAEERQVTPLSVARGELRRG